MAHSIYFSFLFSAVHRFLKQDVLESYDEMVDECCPHWEGDSCDKRKSEKRLGKLQNNITFKITGNRKCTLHLCEIPFPYFR